jgi:hypothetical protein
MVAGTEKSKSKVRVCANILVIGNLLASYGMEMFL